MKDDENIFNLFDDKTKKVLINCQKIAHDMHTISGTDHLLLALLITPNTVSQQILKEHISKLSNINNLLNTSASEKKIVNKNITKEFESILKLAIDNSVKSYNGKVKPENLLWGILKYKNCSAHRILQKLKIDTKDLENEIIGNSQSLEQSQMDINIEDIYINSAIPSEENKNRSDFPQNPQFIFENPMTRFPNDSMKNKKTYLEEFGTNLTKLAQKNKLDKVSGRDKEITRLMRILCRRTKNNPVLVGDPGVGKTAIVEGLAQKIADKKVPFKLINKEIIRLDLALTVAGTMYRGQFETRIKKIISEVIKNKDIILFIDEIHTVVGTGSAEGSMDTANILKPTLAKGQIRLIGATTNDEYRKHIEKDTALERRLQKILIKEPSIQDAIHIVKGLKKVMENYHHVIIEDDALISSVKLSQRYISDRYLPDKAIDLIDEAAAATHLRTSNLKEQEFVHLTDKIKRIIEKKEEAIEKQNFADAAYLRSKELKLKQEISILEKKDKSTRKKKTITEKDIANIVSEWTQIPIDNLIQEDFKEIIKLDKKLSSIVIGQEEAVKTISDTIKKTKTKLVDPHRPLGTFMFLGPTGVGKTYLAKTLARLLFGTDKKLIKIDMSEFMERHNVSRLVGAPPGYIGYDDAGKLTETVRNNPYSVILLDEIEKAHPDVFNILLQVMEDGYITDAKGRQINFRNTIIIMTSNIGLSKLNQMASLGFTKHNQSESYNDIKTKIEKDIKKTFKPEFLNRIDTIAIFKPLSKESIKTIVKLELSKLAQRLSENKIKINFDKKIVDFIADKSYKPEYGAREIRRSIDQYITKKLSEQILKNKNINTINPRITKKTIIFSSK